ncbi:MAG TPA: peptidase M48, partial [Blastocatellia bacterium]
MKSIILKRLTALAVAAIIVSPTTLLAGTQNNSDNKKQPEQAASQPAASASKGKLDDTENPLMIGKRNINKHQINFYSLDKEVALGRQVASQVDQQAKFVDDPVVTEYVNRIGQNLALHSDAKIPFTIKVLDSDDVNAFALPGGFLYVNKGAILAADSEAE